MRLTINRTLQLFKHAKTGKQSFEKEHFGGLLPVIRPSALTCKT